MKFTSATKKLEKAGYKLTQNQGQFYVYFNGVKSITITRNGGFDSDPSVATICSGCNYFPNISQAIKY